MLIQPKNPTKPSLVLCLTLWNHASKETLLLCPFCTSFILFCCTSMAGGGGAAVWFPISHRLIQRGLRLPFKPRHGSLVKDMSEIQTVAPLRVAPATRMCFGTTITFIRGVLWYKTFVTWRMRPCAARASNLHGLFATGSLS